MKKAAKAAKRSVKKKVILIEESPAKKSTMTGDTLRIRDLVEIARSASTKGNPRPRTWLDDLSSEDRKAIIEFTKEFVANGESGRKVHIVRAWQEAGVPISDNKFDRLLDAVRNGKL